jgi:predicted AlkP superfamily pyrophosphatase or phosphodiesterase
MSMSPTAQPCAASMSDGLLRFGAMVAPLVLVISVDGVAPRFLSDTTTPTLHRLRRHGAWTDRARTVMPCVTLPAHHSMVRSLPPERHGITSNEGHDRWDTTPSFLDHAAGAGRRTAFIHNWPPLAGLADPLRLSFLAALDTSEAPDGDGPVVSLVRFCLASVDPQVVFIYLGEVDTAGHAAGWGSAHYLAALARADARVDELLRVAGPEAAAVVTTDHGGSGGDHGEDIAEHMDIFVRVLGPEVVPGNELDDVSILDIAPTVARLGGLDPHPDWRGRSLV